MAIPQSAGILHLLRQTVLRHHGAGLSDGQLLRSFLYRGDEAAFEALVRRHGPMVRGVCRRVLRNLDDADDAFQAAFLVLLRKASSLVEREVLGDWLHGVAYRTALKARTAAARRRLKEKQALRHEAIFDNEALSEWLPLLDEEVGRLPAKYRLPVVLCDLEGRTRKEAAKQLGWPEGTVSGRLSRARAMLARRLTRRGVTLSAAALAAGMAGEASARLPSSVIVPICKAALEGAAGSAAGSVSAHVVALTEGVVKSMFLAKLKNAVALATVAVVLTAGAGAWRYAVGAAQNEERPKEASAPLAPKSDAAQVSRIGAPRSEERRGLSLWDWAAWLVGVAQTSPIHVHPVPQQNKELEVSVEVYFAYIHQSIVEKLNQAGLLKQGSDGKGVLSLDDDKMKRFMEIIQSDIHTNVMQAPRLTMFNGQHSLIEATDKQHFVTGLEIAHRDGKIEYRPKNETISLGWRIAVYSLLSPDHRRVRVHLEAIANNLVSPKVPRLRITTTDDEGKTQTHCIEQPQITKLSVNRHVDIADGNTAVLTTGLKDTIDQATVSKVPILGDLPGLGRLFSNTEYSSRTLHLLVLLTPRIHDPQGREEKLPARVGQIIIIGNEKTPDAKILEQVPLFPGQILSYPDVRIAEQNLSRLKGLKSNPKVAVIEREGDGEFKDIEIKIEEK